MEECTNDQEVEAVKIMSHLNCHVRTKDAKMQIQHSTPDMGTTTSMPDSRTRSTPLTLHIQPARAALTRRP